MPGRQLPAGGVTAGGVAAGQGSAVHADIVAPVVAHPVALKYCTGSDVEYSTCVESSDRASYACEKSYGPLTAPFTVSTRK